MKTVAESRGSESIPLWSHPDWRARFPWLVQGTTASAEAAESLDFGLFGARPVGETTARWRRLRESTAMATAVHSRQVHGAAVATWSDPLPHGLFLVDRYDAHTSTAPGLLLTVSVADCVPIFLVGEEPRVVALVHAGWRGVVAGVFEATLARIESTAGHQVDSLWLHCGPAICGTCYEVGPEVHAAVNPDQPVPDSNRPLDLAAAIARRASRAGIRPDRMTGSAHCTRCGPEAFFSHRAGSPARQLGVLGIRR